MIFNSVEYIFFLIVVLALYYSMRFRQQNYMLLLASYFFYGWWDPKFLFLIVLSTVVDFTAGLMMEKGKLNKSQRVLPNVYLVLSGVIFLLPDWSAFKWHGGLTLPEIDISRFFTLSQEGMLITLAISMVVLILSALYPIGKGLSEQKRRKVFLTLSIVSNLSILGFFKYFNFFVGSAKDGLEAIGINIETSTLDIILPVGISFYTFQTLSYTIDIYRKKIKPTDHFFDFALFVSYFPQLVAGPIERASHLLPALSKPRSISYEMISRGLFLIAFGLFKKICIADGVAPSVDSVFNTSGSVTWVDVSVASLLFALQIYCDFSGYSDIARGTSKLLGIDLMINFKSPYFSKTPSEFWQRWHISLSSWLRDYLYVSLGGNRSGKLKTYRNLVLTMLLGGLWHGAAWNFILWGAYQGFLLLIYRALGIKEANGSYKSVILNKLHNLLVIVFFFIITCYGWMLFRATSIDQIIEFTAILFMDFGNLDFTIKRPVLSALAGIPILISYELFHHLHNSGIFYKKWHIAIRANFYAAILFLTVMGMSNAPTQFIYFQF